MIIRMLGQGEPLGTRSCVSVRNEGRTSGFDVFEFGNREDVCGGNKKVGKIVRARFTSGNALFSLEWPFFQGGDLRASFVQRSRTI